MALMRILKSLVKRLPGISAIVAQRDALLASTSFVPPGHFLSPIVSIPEYLADQANAPSQPPTALPGIELNEASQVALLQTLAPFWHADLFNKGPTSTHRYFSDNPAFGPADAFVLHAMIAHFKPKRLIEVGCGFSSCVTLDVNEHLFDNKISLAFIEPFPQLFHKLIKEGDLEQFTLLPQRLQDVPLAFFDQLGEGDIFFVDSTHVSKVGSDVNYLFFEILPRLAKGVLVHIHDIFYPFGYPKEWILEGRSWNEAFVLRAFLQYNTGFEIVLFSNYLATVHNDLTTTLLPELALDGGSIWLRTK
jgi:hypothetical protein